MNLKPCRLSRIIYGILCKPSGSLIGSVHRSMKCHFCIQNYRLVRRKKAHPVLFRSLHADMSGLILFRWIQVQKKVCPRCPVGTASPLVKIAIQLHG